MNKLVGIIILNYKVSDLVNKCLASVNKSDYKKIKIYIIDNDSRDLSATDIKKFTKTTFIQNNVNSGYTGGNNLGIKQALKDGCDYVFILNPDTTVEKNTISELVKTLESNNAAIAGPKIYFSDSKKIWFAGGVIDLANVIGGHLGVDEVDSGQYDQVTEVDYITGAAILIKREVLNKVGLFDERYFLYYEDSDLCYRSKKAGYKIIYVPTAIVYHKNAQSTGLGSPLQDYYQTRNRMLFASKFLSFRTRFALFREGLRNVMIYTRRKALMDFLLSKFGKGI